MKRDLPEKREKLHSELAQEKFANSTHHLTIRFLAFLLFLFFQQPKFSPNIIFVCEGGVKFYPKPKRTLTNLLAHFSSHSLGYSYSYTHTHSARAHIEFLVLRKSYNPTQAKSFISIE